MTYIFTTSSLSLSLSKSRLFAGFGFLHASSSPSSSCSTSSCSIREPTADKPLAELAGASVEGANSVSDRTLEAASAQVTNSAPQGTDSAPQGENSAPQVPNSAPQGANSAPQGALRMLADEMERIRSVLLCGVLLAERDQGVVHLLLGGLLPTLVRLTGTTPLIYSCSLTYIADVLLGGLLPTLVRLTGTQFTCFTSTKVQILTPGPYAAAPSAASGARIFNLLAVLVQKYKY